MGTEFLSGPVIKGEEILVLNLKREELKPHERKKFSMMKVVRHWLLREVVGASFLQGQAGQGCEQPDLVEDVPAHYRGWT